jgi:hypothetical protein
VQPRRAVALLERAAVGAADEEERGDGQQPEREEREEEPPQLRLAEEAALPAADEQELLLGAQQHQQRDVVEQQVGDRGDRGQRDREAGDDDGQREPPDPFADRRGGAGASVPVSGRWEVAHAARLGRGWQASQA